jgi:hypothetical protein
LPELLSLIERLGAPLAFAVVAVWALTTERIVPGRRLDAMRADCDAQLAQQRADAQAHEAELRRDRDYYRQVAFRLLNHAERGLGLADRAAGLSEREDVAP